MNPSPSTQPRRLTDAPAAPHALFGAIYFSLLRPDGNGRQRLQKVLEAAGAYSPHLPGSAAPLEQIFSQFLGKTVRLREPQLQAFQRLVQTPAFASLSPWGSQAQRGEIQEMASASSLHDVYLALLKPDGGMMKRFKDVQAAAALYEPQTPGSQHPLEHELTRLVGQPVRLSEVQLRCFKELLIDEPAFAHIAPWEDLTASW